MFREFLALLASVGQVAKRLLLVAQRGVGAGRKQGGVGKVLGAEPLEEFPGALQ